MKSVNEGDFANLYVSALIDEFVVDDFVVVDVLREQRQVSLNSTVCRAAYLHTVSIGPF